MKKNAKIIAATLSMLEIFDELIGIKKSKKAFICIPRLHALSQKIEQVENFSAIDVNNFWGQTIFAANPVISFNFDPIKISWPIIALINFMP